MEPADGTTTKVVQTDLNSFQKQSHAVLDDLQLNIMAPGVSDAEWSSGTVPMLDGSLQVRAGTKGFPAAQALNKRLAEVGAGVEERLLWFEQVLLAMDGKFTATRQGFADNETRNDGSAKAFRDSFPDTVNGTSNDAGSSLADGGTDGAVPAVDG